MSDRPACLGIPEPYDVLIDVISGPVHEVALGAARKLCGGCPAASTCLTDNRDEQWARQILGQPIRHFCGTRRGYKAHREADETPCKECREANAYRERANARARREAAA